MSSLFIHSTHTYTPPPTPEPEPVNRASGHPSGKKSLSLSPRHFLSNRFFSFLTFFFLHPFFFITPLPFVPPLTFFFLTSIHTNHTHGRAGQIERCRHCGVRSFTHFGGTLDVHYSDIHVHTHVYTTQRLPVQLVGQFGLQKAVMLHRTYGTTVQMGQTEG
jgi:hypothetical protein